MSNLNFFCGGLRVVLHHFSVPGMNASACRAPHLSCARNKEQHTRLSWLVHYDNSSAMENTKWYMIFQGVHARAYARTHAGTQARQLARTPMHARTRARKFTHIRPPARSGSAVPFAARQVSSPPRERRSASERARRTQQSPAAQAARGSVQELPWR